MLEIPGTLLNRVEEYGAMTLSGEPLRAIDLAWSDVSLFGRSKQSSTQTRYRLQHHACLWSCTPTTS